MLSAVSINTKCCYYHAQQNLCCVVNGKPRQNVVAGWSQACVQLVVFCHSEPL